MDNQSSTADIETLLSEFEAQASDALAATQDVTSALEFDDWSDEDDGCGLDIVTVVSPALENPLFSLEDCPSHQDIEDDHSELDEQTVEEEEGEDDDDDMQSFLPGDIVLDFVWENQRRKKNTSSSRLSTGRGSSSFSSTAHDAKLWGVDVVKAPTTTTAKVSSKVGGGGGGFGGGSRGVKHQRLLPTFSGKKSLQQQAPPMAAVATSMARGRPAFESQRKVVADLFSIYGGPPPPPPSGRRRQRQTPAVVRQEAGGGGIGNSTSSNSADRGPVAALAADESVLTEFEKVSVGYKNSGGGREFGLESESDDDDDNNDHSIDPDVFSLPKGGGWRWLSPWQVHWSIGKTKHMYFCYVPYDSIFRVASGTM